MLKKSVLISFLLLNIILVFSVFGFDVDVFVNTESGRAAISPYIYGTNQYLSETENLANMRMGGNRMTGYNWENNASNAGKDYNHSSDDFVSSWIGVPSADRNTPGAAIKLFHDKNLEKNRYSLVTLQMAGYAARDKNGTVSEAEAAPSNRWDKVQYAKGTAFSNAPDLTDGTVYMDEFVNFLVTNYGNAAAARGVKGYALDNEPALWPDTHPRIHPGQTTVAELNERTISLAKAVKNVDPYAEIFGPALYGFGAFVSLQWTSDWPPAGYTSDDYYIDYYLKSMKTASDAAGKRLIDVLDVHWYPEAYAAGNRVCFYSATDYTSAAAVAAGKVRVQMTRTLWDPNFCTAINHEDSWILNLAQFQKYFPLIPKLQESINQNYPGTKLGITEYGFGGDDHISGGIAQADALGFYGKLGVYFTTYWQILSKSDYITAAFKIYRNYDNNNSTFGNTKVYSQISDIPRSAVYAAINDSSNTRLHLILINKDFDNAMNANLVLASAVKYTSGTAWGFDSTSSAIKQFTGISSIANNRFVYTLPKASVVHLILQSDGSAAPQPVPTAPPTPVPVLFEGKVALEYQCGDTNAASTQIRPLIKLVNSGITGFSLSAITLRYYFSDPAYQNYVFTVDHAGVGAANVTGTIKNGYIEIGFLPDAGSLGAGKDSGDIQVRINKSDWSALDQADDYSFNPAYTGYAAYDKITLYLNGQLLLGKEPPGTNPTITPVQTRTPTTAPTRTPGITLTATANGLLGDVNSSGVVDIVDALMTAQYYVGLNPAGFNVSRADVNRDGQVTIVDALMIAQYYVGLIPGF